jgi:hypothetical protein
MDRRYRNRRRATAPLTDEDLREIERGEPGSPLPAFYTFLVIAVGLILYFGR